MKKDRFVEIINNMINKRIVVIGDIMIDKYVIGNVNRISPEAPVPVLDVTSEYFTLGGAGNVAKNIVSLGSECVICSVIGLDVDGSKLIEYMESLDINSSGMFIDPQRKTTVKTRVMSGTQQIVRIDKEDRKQINQNIFNSIIETLKSTNDVNAIIISDYAKGVISTGLIEEIVKISKEKNIPINVDPKDKNYNMYYDVATITPNIKELSFGTGISISSDEDIERAVNKTFQLLNCNNVIVTRGEDGMSIFSNPFKNDMEKQIICHIPTVAKKVFDVSGAGDTVISAFTLARVAGATLEEASKISNMAAGIVVEKVGSYAVSINELSNAYDYFIN